MSDLTLTISVDKSPAEVFAAVNNVPAWWSGDIEGGTDQLGDEFTYRYKDIHYSRQRVTELIAGSRVVWHVTDAHLSFAENKSEWKGTDVIFDISAKDGGTELRFTHVGLAPDCDCYEACSDGWGRFIAGNLRRFILTGETQPNPFEA